MSSPLLTSKLSIPLLREDRVSRARLFKALKAGLGCKLILICAPAGFGKTTLVSEWAQRCGLPVAWLSLEESDNDPVRFLTYFISALQFVEKAAGKETLALLNSTQPHDFERLLTVLVNEIEEITQDFVFVLDDYHLIEAQSVNDLISFILEHKSENMKVVISTRIAPGLKLSRLRSMGHLHEVDETNLRFTLEETSSMFDNLSEIDLTVEEIAILTDRTEGWVAGLQLASISLKGRDDVHGYIRDFAGTNRYIFDYLMEEVLTRLDEDTREFLLHTSILDRLCGSLCEYVTQLDHGQAMLDKLENANLFLLPLDQKRLWYRYHHLFAQFLRKQLEMEEPAQIPELHNRAAKWNEENGNIQSAVTHAQAASDYERAVRLLEEHAMNMLMRGETTTLLSWLDALPDSVLRSRPWLCLVYAWILVIIGKLDRIESWLARVEESLSRGGEDPERREMEGHIAAIRSYYSTIEVDASSSFSFADEALEKLADDDLLVRSVVAYTLGGTKVFEGRVAGAMQAFSDAAQLGERSGNLHVAISALCALGDFYVFNGKLCNAIENYQKALDLAVHNRERPLPAGAKAFTGLSEVRYEQNDLDIAKEYAERGIEICSDWGIEDSWVSGYIILARTHLATGNLERASRAIQKAAGNIENLNSTQWVMGQLKVREIGYWLQRGDLEAAKRWVEPDMQTLDNPLGYIQQFARTKVQVREVIGKEKATVEEIEQTIYLLDRMIKATNEVNWFGSMLEFYILKSIAHFMLNDIGPALDELEKALNLGEPEGYMRIFLDADERVRDLLNRLETSVEDGSRHLDQRLRLYVRRLLTAYLVQPDAEIVKDQLIEPLSEHELKVLMLIAAGLSNREAAEELYLSVNTVKWHLRNIYGKLNTRGRVEAISRARELGLL